MNKPPNFFDLVASAAQRKAQQCTTESLEAWVDNVEFAKERARKESRVQPTSDVELACIKLVIEKRKYKELIWSSLMCGTGLVLFAISYLI